MSQLSWMITITDRKKAPDFVALYQQQNIHVSLTTVGAGTAVSETLNYLGLERTEKAVIFTTVTDSRWKAVKRQLEHTMNIFDTMPMEQRDMVSSPANGPGPVTRMNIRP